MSRAHKEDHVVKFVRIPKHRHALQAIVTYDYLTSFMPPNVLRPSSHPPCLINRHFTYF